MQDSSWGEVYNLKLKVNVGGSMTTISPFAVFVDAESWDKRNEKTMIQNSWTDETYRNPLLLFTEDNSLCHMSL